MAQSGQLVDETSVDQEADDRQEEPLPQAGYPAADRHILDQRQENTAERQNRGDHGHTERDVSEGELPANLRGGSDTAQGRTEDGMRTCRAPTGHREPPSVEEHSFPRSSWQPRSFVSPTISRVAYLVALRPRS